MQVPVRGLQKAKFVIHCIQVPLLFVVWCLTIGVLVVAGVSSSPTKWYFAVCWLTIPALIYQTMVSRFERTRRFANPYAYAAIDVLFSVLWFSGFVAVAVWNASGIKRGAEKQNADNGNGTCNTFDFGSPGRCRLSQGSVGVGVVLTLLFSITSAISVYGINYYRKNGHLPGDTSNFPDPMTMPMTKPNDAFSASMDDEDEEMHVSKPNGSRPLESEAYRPLNDYEAQENGHANGYENGYGNGHADGWNNQQQATPYGGQYEDAVYPAGGHSQPQDDYFAPAPAQAGNGTIPFPRADYDRA